MAHSIFTQHVCHRSGHATFLPVRRWISRQQPALLQLCPSHRFPVYTKASAEAADGNITGPAGSAAAQDQSQPWPKVVPEEVQGGHFEEMLARLLEWKEKYYDCIVPRQAFDAAELGEWVHRLRRLRSQGRLPEEVIERLDGAGFAWRVDNITAKWYHNLHVVRRYKELHGTAEIPQDFMDPEEPDFVEAARWLARQKDLYTRQKLLRIRVRQLKEALGIKLERAYAPVRRNLHPVVLREDAKFQAELDRRAQRAQQDAQQPQQAGSQQAQQAGPQQPQQRRGQGQRGPVGAGRRPRQQGRAAQQLQQQWGRREGRRGGKSAAGDRKEGAQ